MHGGLNIPSKGHGTLATNLHERSHNLAGPDHRHHHLPEFLCAPQKKHLNNIARSVIVFDHDGRTGAKRSFSDHQ